MLSRDHNLPCQRRVEATFSIDFITGDFHQLKFAELVRTTIDKFSQIFLSARELIKDHPTNFQANAPRSSKLANVETEVYNLRR